MIPIHACERWHHRRVVSSRPPPPTPTWTPAPPPRRVREDPDPQWGPLDKCQVFSRCIIVGNFLSFCGEIWSDSGTNTANLFGLQLMLYYLGEFCQAFDARFETTIEFLPYQKLQKKHEILAIIVWKTAWWRPVCCWLDGRAMMAK